MQESKRLPLVKRTDGVSDKVKGLTVIFTGDGKGKTSAALGALFRSLGHGFNCKVIQFIKARKDTGEFLLAKTLAPKLEFVQFGKGFTWKKDFTMAEHKAAAQEGIKTAMQEIASGRYGMVVLDEILYALGKELVSLAQIIELIEKKPASMHLILTGRGAPDELIEKADLVTEMKEIKHPMKSGIPAQKGLDF